MKLVVSGDSWTAPQSETKRGWRVALRKANGHYEEEEEYPRWPDLLAEMLGMELINLGRISRGNEYIYNSIVDELCKEKKNVGLAIVMWSEHSRWDFSGSNIRPHKDIHSGIRTLHIDPTIGTMVFKGWKSKEMREAASQVVNTLLDKNMVSTEHNYQKSHRWYHAFQNHCEANDIPYLQCSAFGSSQFNDPPHKIVKMLLDHPIIHDMNKETFYGWPLYHDIGGFTISDKLDDVDPMRIKMRVSEDDMHPNKEGHAHIAELLYDQIEMRV